MIDEAEIHRMANSADVEERRKAVQQLADDFTSFSDKATAWTALHKLTQDEDSYVRKHAAYALGSAFSHIPDKDAAWVDLHRLTQDEDSYVQVEATDALGSAFSHIPDKDAAWADLHRLTQEGSSHIRWSAAYALGSAFSDIPDREGAWADLIRLTQDEDSEVRMHTASVPGSVFLHVRDKRAAWIDLHYLTLGGENEVLWGAASALGSAFSHIPDKELAWSDLIRLKHNENRYVRMYAYHSLGSASIYKATKTGDEENFKMNLERAIGYFEKSSKETNEKFFDPTRFCLPFYRSYYAIISEKQEAEIKAAEYLDEAKKATGRSESKEALIKAVENLANALKEAQKPLDFSETKEQLSAYRQYCDHTAELADSARGKSPVAAAAILRGIPIVGIKLKGFIAEIQEKANEACRDSQGTPTEEIACTVNQEFQKRYISNHEDLTRNIESIIFILKSKIPKIPQNEHIHEKIEKLREEYDMAKYCAMVPLIIALIPDASIHTGDIINIEGKTASNDSPIIGKVDGYKNGSVNLHAIAHESPKKSWMTRFNNPVTLGGFIGFATGGIGTYLYPNQSISHISVISVGIAMLAVIIFTIINKD